MNVGKSSNTWIVWVVLGMFNYPLFESPTALGQSVDRRMPTRAGP